MNRSFKVMVVAMMLLSIFAAVTPVASARLTGTTETQRVAALERKIIGDQAPSAGEFGDAQVVTKTRDGVGISISNQSSRGVMTTNAQGQALTMTLPGASLGNKIGTAAVAYNNAADQATFVAEATNDGTVRGMTFLYDSHAPKSYTFTFRLGHVSPTLRLNADGSVAVLNGAKQVGIIAPAWAIDAAGRAVPTRYQVSGNSLTQAVDAAPETVFPVVADPTYGWGYTNVTAYLNRNETYQMAVGGAASAGLLAAICAATGIQTSGVGCAIGITESAVISAAAFASWGSGNCIKIRIYYVGILYPENQKFGARGCY